MYQAVSGRNVCGGISNRKLINSELSFFEFPIPITLSVKELPTATPLLDNHARSSSMGGNGGATAISKNKLCGPIR